MDAFHVLLRPIQGDCRVRVDGIANARWLLGRLSHSFIFKNSEPIRGETDSNYCTFGVSSTSQVSQAALVRILAKIPEVMLKLEAA